MPFTVRGTEDYHKLYASWIEYQIHVVGFSVTHTFITLKAAVKLQYNFTEYRMHYVLDKLTIN